MFKYTCRIFALMCLVTCSWNVYPMAEKVGSLARAFCYSCIPFAKRENAIAKSRLFYACLDPRDVRVPRVFLQTHEHLAALSQWQPEHWQEFGQFEKVLEEALRKAFGAELVNVACLMNLAGKAEGTHTHWHFIPRLRNIVTIVDEGTQQVHVLQDPCYGKAYDMHSENYIVASPAVMGHIVRRVQEHLDIAQLPEGELKK